MPKCKNFDTGTYKGTEPSPKGRGYCAKGEKINKKMKGNDGNMWIINETKAGVKRWIKFTKKSKTPKTSKTTKSKTTKSKTTKSKTTKSKTTKSKTTKTYFEVFVYLNDIKNISKKKRESRVNEDIIKDNFINIINWYKKNTFITKNIKIKSKNIETLSFIVELTHDINNTQIIEDLKSILLNPDNDGNYLFKNKYIVYTKILKIYKNDIYFKILKDGLDKLFKVKIKNNKKDNIYEFIIERKKNYPMYNIVSDIILKSGGANNTEILIINKKISKEDFKKMQKNNKYIYSIDNVGQNNINLIIIIGGKNFNNIELIKNYKL